MTVLIGVNLFSFLCFVSFFTRPGFCFPNGPPLSTCMSMFPKHKVDLSWKDSGPCPFKIKLSNDTYQPKDNITIVIEADDGSVLEGFQISAHRKSANTEEFQGTFLSFSPEDKLQFLHCVGGANNQVGHKNDEEVARLELQWQAPDVNVGDLIFKATIVQEYDVFWAWETAELKTSNPNTVVAPAILLEVPSQEMNDINFNGCGTDKGCFFYPQTCRGSDCVAALTYQKNGDSSYTIEMVAEAPGFVTMGLSKDQIMGMDHTITCTLEGNLATVQNGLNPAYFNDRVYSKNLTNLKVKKTDTHIMCTFTRPQVVLAATMPFTGPPLQTLKADLGEDWYIMMAWGHVPPGTDVMGKHVELPVVSTNLANFQENGKYVGRSLGEKVQAHGALMVVAWMLLAGLAIVIARHYKNCFPGRTLFGTKLWFQIHRALVVSVFFITVICFIIIFVLKQGLSDSERGGYIHAIVGIVVGVAVLLQVFGGLIRPGPDSSIRPFFNWGHRLMGQLTHILAAVNLILAFNMTYTPKPMRHFGTIVVVVWIVLQILWEIAFEVWTWKKSSSQGKSSITDNKGMTIQDKNTAPSSRTDTIMFGLYFITLLTLCIATICAILIY